MGVAADDSRRPRRRRWVGESLLSSALPESTDLFGCCFLFVGFRRRKKCLLWNEGAQAPRLLEPNSRRWTPSPGGERATVEELRFLPDGFSSALLSLSLRGVKGCEDERLDSALGRGGEEGRRRRSLKRQGLQTGNREAVKAFASEGPSPKSRCYWRGERAALPAAPLV